MPLPIDANATVKQIATGFLFAEGPVFSRRGYLLFSDVDNDRIMKWERGQTTVFRNASNRANGLTFDHQGRLLTAEGGQEGGGGRITRTEKNGSITVLAAKDLQRPNDLVYAIDGSIYFTDLPASLVYQITRQGQIRPVADAPAPNGLALSPNQQQLYIAGMKEPMVRVHDIEPDGRLKPGKDFASLRVDGLKTDESGNVWMASGEGISVFTAKREPLGGLKVPEVPTNCAWGDGFRTLYITAGKSVYAIPTKAAGTRTF
ncbi:MAG TPA: SMP-30/gluconolactonase/LRE family protein [Bryobacteraceae bacterium]|nr:SMP-30/gluconolactonase/LRE family protein [Bryobacteraceae bacterium]